MKKDLIKKIETLILQAKNGKQQYYNSIQQAIDLYLNHFNELNGNVTPLKNLFECCKKDTLALRDYIYKVSNISFMGFVKDKNNNYKLSLKTDGNFSLNDKFGVIKWYESTEKKKIETLLNDETLLKSLVNMYKRFNKEETQVKTENLNALNNLIKRLSKNTKK